MLRIRMCVVGGYMSEDRRWCQIDEMKPSG